MGQKRETYVVDFRDGVGYNQKILEADCMGDAVAWVENNGGTVIRAAIRDTKDEKPAMLKDLKELTMQLETVLREMAKIGKVRIVADDTGSIYRYVMTTMHPFRKEVRLVCTLMEPGTLKEIDGKTNAFGG